MLEEVYEQRWHHAQHQEQQRLTFTEIFCVIYGIILTYSYSVSSITREENLIVFVFLLILSTLGFLFIDRWNLAFIKNRAIVRRIHQLWHIPDPSDRELKFLSIPVAVIYAWFYVLCFGFSLCLIFNIYFTKITILYFFFLMWLPISIIAGFLYKKSFSNRYKTVLEYFNDNLILENIYGHK